MTIILNGRSAGITGNQHNNTHSMRSGSEWRPSETQRMHKSQKGYFQTNVPQKLSIFAIVLTCINLLGKVQARESCERSAFCLLSANPLTHSFSFVCLLHRLIEQKYEIQLYLQLSWHPPQPSRRDQPARPNQRYAIQMNLTRVRRTGR